jgi:hypothetical protein
VSGDSIKRADRSRRWGTGWPASRPTRLSFDAVRFNWVYDLRKGPDGCVYVLDSKNFALRVIDPDARSVRLLAGTGAPGYSGDGADGRSATFGSDPAATFDGPISLSLDDAGNAYIGDRHNHVVREIERAGGMVSTIAGRPDPAAGAANDSTERDPLRLNLPMISSMDYNQNRLFVPTDLGGDAGDLAVLSRSSATQG